MSFPYLRHPLVLLTLFLTFLNDQYIKSHYQSWFSSVGSHDIAALIVGKLSDMTGLFYFPLFLYALISFVRRPSDLHRLIHMKHLLGCILITDILFVLFKLTPARVFLVENFSHYVLNIQIVPDWTDLLVMPVQIGTYRFAQKYQSPVLKS